MICKPTPTGETQAECEAQCSETPIVPPQLRGKFFRGLEIDMAYLPGEWTAQFSDFNVTVIDPAGKSKNGKIISAAQFVTIVWHDSQRTQSLWQFQGGPAVDYLSWAWGALGGPAPTNFDQAMTEKGQSEYFFVACPVEKQKSCEFRKPTL